MTTDFETAIPVTAIDEDALRILIQSLRQATGKKVDLQQLFVISTDDVNVACMLDNLRDSIKGDGANGKAKEKPATVKLGRRSKVHKVKDAAPEMGKRSW